MNVNPGLGTDFRSLADGTALRRFEDSSGVRGENVGRTPGLTPGLTPWSAAGHRRGAGSSPTWGATQTCPFDSMIYSQSQLCARTSNRINDLQLALSPGDETH